MDCATHPGVTAVSTCTRCSRSICSTCHRTLDGRDYCAPCVAELEAKLAPRPTETVAPPVAPMPIVADAGFPLRGVLFAAVAGGIGAILWFGFVAMTDMKLGLVAIGVGWLVGRGAVLGAGGGGKQLAVFSLVIGLLAMTLGEYLILNHAMHAYFSQEEPGRVIPALLSPAKLFPIYLDSFGVMDIVFYAIGAWEAFSLPFRASPRA